MKTSIETEVNNLSKQIAIKYKPQKIIIFGSYAKGAMTLDSDLDFLIIKEKVPGRIIDRARKLRKLIKKRIPADFIIYSSGEFEERKKMEDPFIQEIIKEGKVLYDKQKSNRRVVSES